MIYEQHYEDNIYEFILKEDVRSLLLKAELVGQFHDKDMERAAKKIEKGKIQLYLDYWDRTKTRRNRMVLNSAKKAQLELLAKGMAFDHLTLEHYCETKALQYQIGQTLREFKTKELILNDRSSQSEFENYISLINQHTLEISTIRALCRTEYWKNYYGAGESNIFGKPVAELNPEQVSMISTTKMYDRVMEHSESPDSKIIEDDDALDGWVLYQSEKAKEEKKKGGNKTSKIDNSEEVFYMAENKDQRDDILALNNNSSSQIQRNRMNQVMKHEGPIESSDFQDVRQTLNEAVANKQKKV